MAAKERVTDEEPTAATRVPDGIPTPLTGTPITIPVVLARPEIVMEPLAVLPVNVTAAGKSSYWNNFVFPRASIWVVGSPWYP